MTDATKIVIGVIVLYLYSKSKTTSQLSPGPGQPGFVGPVQPASAGIPPAVNMPISWVSCADPNADPVMCSMLYAQ